MSSHIEVLDRSATRILVLEGQRLTIGKSPENDISFEDHAVSHLHAALERYGSEWIIKDLGSKNGTYVNGEAIFTDRKLQPGDELRVGNTLMVFRSERASDVTSTQGIEPPPELTRRERDVLVALCRPVMSGSMFTRPASVKEIAAELVVTENAVKQHLGRLYDKFAIYSAEGGPRQLQLANEAIRRGAVHLGDLR